MRRRHDGRRMRGTTSGAAGPALFAAVSCLFAPAPQFAQDHEHGSDAPGNGDAMAGMVREAGPPRLPEESPLIEIRVLGSGREVEIVLGPVALPAGGPHLRPPVQLAELPLAGWLHGYSWEMRDRGGDLLPDRLLHHVNVIDPDNRELFSAVPRRLVGAGRETKRQGIPKVLGVPIAQDTRVLVSAMFAPGPDRSFDEAYLHVTIHFTPADSRRMLGPWTVYPFYVDVMGPVGEKEFPLLPGTHTVSWEGSPAVDGRILAIGGHLHDYADWLRLEDVTAGEIVWETRPEVDEAGRTVGVPTSMLWWRGGVRVRKDHVYRVSARYTNPLAKPAPDGGMGAIGGVILAAEDAWPEFDRRHPDYVQDLRNTLEKPNRGTDAHAHHAPSGED